MRVRRLLPFALAAFLVWMGALAVYIASNGDNDFDGFHRAATHLLTEGQLSSARDIERYPPTFQVHRKIVLHARRAGDMDAWLAGYAAISLAMLLVSPIVWTHDFLWWLPAGLALRRHERALVILAVCSLLATTMPATRSLGFHIFTTLGLLLAIERTQAAEARGPVSFGVPQREEPRIAG